MAVRTDPASAGVKPGIIIVGAGIMQIPAIRTAKELGLFVIASDKNQDAPGFEFCDHALVLDTKDFKGHLRFARENKAKFNISGAFAGADVAITVAHITEALGLRGIPVSVAERSNNKWLMKQRWLRDRIATPYAEEVRSLEEAKRVLRRVALPAMVKAVDNAASRGTRRIDAEAELEGALAEARRCSSTDTALIEEYVEGEEQSVECIAHDGMHHRFGIVDRHFQFKPYAIEIGHTNPTRRAPAEQEALYELTRAAADSLGIDRGPYKSDTIWTKKGPMILELPARLSGGFHSQYTTPLATGMDPIRSALRLAVGMDFDPADAATRLHRTAVCEAVFPVPGRVAEISRLEEAQTLPGVAHIFLLVGEGEKIEPYRNCAHRVCYIITIGETSQEARHAFERARDTLQIRTEPLQ